MFILAQVAPLAVVVFAAFVLLVLGLSFYLGNRTKSADGYFAAGGKIHWSVNGVSFAGDYLSAASFLGICGMIATAGYDGFLYSIGYLAGWIVALFVVAEPMKRLGKYTFTDALDSKFNSKGIQLMAAVSTLIVSVCYLIPQMVGAGALVTPLLGLEHWVGVVMVGIIVITIVATAGMASTTYVQFIKGALLIIVSTILVAAVCNRGLTTKPDQGGAEPYYEYKTLAAAETHGVLSTVDKSYSALGGKIVPVGKDKHKTFVKLAKLIEVTKGADGIWTMPLKSRIIKFDKYIAKLDKLQKTDGQPTQMLNGVKHIYVNMNGFQVPVKFEGHIAIIDGIKFVEKDGKIFARIISWWEKVVAGKGVKLQETQWSTILPDAGKWNNGLPAAGVNAKLMQVGNLEAINGKKGKEADTGSVGPFRFLADLSKPDTKIRLWKKAKFQDDADAVTVYYPVVESGNNIMRPGLKFKVSGSFVDKLDFTSLMLALFLGTAALPHILIRYYTVPSPACARKSTIVAIAAIGFFYVLTMYMGLGAMVSSVVNPEDNNMSAPLLAHSFNPILFAVISAIAFATVLGTVSGLIVAASGAVAHDLMDRFCNLKMNDRQKVTAGKLAAFTVGLVAIILGILFKGMNVSYLVGWAFAVAASANLPAIIMLLFWKKTTSKGIAWSILVGIVVSLGLIMLSPTMFARYGLDPNSAPLPFSNPGIVSIPLSFITLIVVSLCTQKKPTPEFEVSQTS